MDGISAAASILALVAAAAQTSRTIYNVLSDIKSGFKDVQSLASGASSLERVLHQLSALIDPVSPLQSTQHVVTLEQSVRRCAGDLDLICEQLWKLWHHDTEGPAKKVWKFVKVAIKHDDIQRMSRIIQQHVSMLTLQVVVLSSQETLQQSRLLSELAHSLREPGYFQSMSQEYKPRDLFLQQDTSATLLAIRNKLDVLPASTATEFNMTKSLIEKIEVQVEMASATAETPKHGVNIVLKQHELDDLNESLQRLSELAQQEARNAHSAEAEDIVEDIHVLIGSLLQHYQQECSTNRKRKRGVLPIEDVESERALKQMKSMINTSEFVSINPKARPPRDISSNSDTVVVRHNRNYLLPQGTASVFTTLVKESNSKINAQYQHARTLAFSAMVEYLPSSPFSYAKIVAHLEHRAGRFGSTTLYPALTICPIIPKESEVFVAIGEGDVIKLETLFRERRASPRDCDPNGRSLLGYACSHDKPEICKYLLEQGADGDAIEKADFGDGQYEFSPLLLHCGTHDPALECQRLLLASGADPSQATADELCPFELALYKPILLNHIKYYARDLMNTEERDSGGDTLLLRFMHRYIYNPWALRFLLDIGADLSARTSWGNTCLHLCFIKACRETSDFRCDDLQLLPSLSMLISAGADVCAVNWAGESVSYLACDRGPQDRTQCDIGSFTMDAWLTVLKKRGYRPVDVMCDASLSHKARFTQKYREEHFEAMQRWEPSMTSHIFDEGLREWVEHV